MAGEYTRMFYAFNPNLGDAHVAGGALDEMTDVTAGFAYLFLRKVIHSSMDHLLVQRPTRK